MFRASHSTSFAFHPRRATIPFWALTVHPLKLCILPCLHDCVTTWLIIWSGCPCLYNFPTPTHSSSCPSGCQPMWAAYTHTLLLEYPASGFPNWWLCQKSAQPLRMTNEMVESAWASMGYFLHHHDPDIRKIIIRLEHLHLKILKRKHTEYAYIYRSIYIYKCRSCGWYKI